MVQLKLCAKLFCLSVILSVAAEREHPKTPRALSREHSLRNEEERKTEYWMAKAQNILAAKLEHTEQLNQKKAKNIIMFLGDGMSVHTVTAARNLIGDSSVQIAFEKFPYMGLSKTYCVDRQVPDSACTATAYLGGVKANYNTIGVNGKVPWRDCKLAQDPVNHVESIAKWAQDAGMDTGLVTTTRVTHASPAGVYAHTPNRFWETDYSIEADKCSAKDNVDIARQLVEWPVGKKLEVIMGGGRQNFLDRSMNDEEGYRGFRSDGRNLIKDWIQDKESRKLNARYVWSRKGLMDLNLNTTDYVLGLFSNSHCPYHGDIKRKRRELAEPTLTEMTEAAIKVLSRNDKGFFLFVEGGRIDLAHHETRARKALEDTVEFANAIQRARNLTSEEDTLIVVTSDHSHTMTINGYPFRDQAILGLGNKNADDDKPFTILSYANGPGYKNTYSKEDGRVVIKSKQTDDAEFEYMASVPLNAETHGGDDVGVFASGPYAHFFSGNYEQTVIPALMAKAAQIGPFAAIKHRVD